MSLGAQFDPYNGSLIDSDNYFEYNYGVYQIPSAEQMLVWLETRGVTFDVSLQPCGYRFDVYSIQEPGLAGLPFKLEFISKNDRNSRVSATMAAIDSSLEYLLNHKKK